MNTEPTNDNSSRDESAPDKALRFDIAIIGGGMAGSVAAYGFAQLGLRVALVEAIEPDHEKSLSFDQRAVALSASSVKILESLDLWRSIAHLACPIKSIHVSDRGQFGFARLEATEFQVEAMGQVIPLDLSGPLLWRRLESLDGLTCYCPWQVTEMKQKESGLKLELASVSDNKGGIDQSHATNQQSGPRSTASIEARLVLAADGTFSRAAEICGLDYDRQPYSQHAVIANLEVEKPHQFKAFERFTESGPLALLPLRQNQMSLVWCHKPEQAELVMALDDTLFLNQLQQAFGYRLGKLLRVSPRVAYPLASHWPRRHFGDNLLLMGNAAHTLHPIAGQGFNLGLRDIAVLLEQVAAAIVTGAEFETPEFLSTFVESRRSDWQLTHFATDGLARLFSNDFYPLVLARNKGLALFNRLPMTKRSLARAAMGFAGRNSQLACGINLEQLQRNLKRIYPGSNP